MFKPFIDLHTHTTLSDGKMPPEALLTASYNAGIRVLAITDHNHTTDLTPLRRYAAEHFEEEMVLIQGAEVSADYHNQELHIVALGFDPEHPEMKAMLAHNRPDRRPYIEPILKRLREECGIDLGTYDEICALFPETKYIGRMVLARLLHARGYVSSVDEAFDIYLGAHGQRRAYVKNPLRYYSLEETVRIIIAAGGVPILAHLLYYGFDNGCRTGGEEKEQLVSCFKSLVDAWGGRGGMEVYYTRYNGPEHLYLLEMSRKYGLFISAGSDYHNTETWETLEHRTSWSVCSRLLEHLGVEVPGAVKPEPIFVMSGFSGVGKGAVCAQLLRNPIGGRLSAVIRSVTSRAPRSKGENYTFVSREVFAELAASHQLLEHTDAYSSNGYGTPVAEVRKALDAGMTPLLEIDRVGLCRLLGDGRIDPELIRSVFVVAPAEEVAKRLYLRGTETEEAILRRLETAIVESGYLDQYDAVIVNDTIAQAAADAAAVFEGKSVSVSFDPADFRRELRGIIDNWQQWKTGIAGSGQAKEGCS